MFYKHHSSFQYLGVHFQNTCFLKQAAKLLEDKALMAEFVKLIQTSSCFICFLCSLLNACMLYVMLEYAMLSE